MYSQFLLVWKWLTLLLFLKGIFTGHRILDWHFLPNSSKTSFHIFLVVQCFCWEFSYHYNCCSFKGNMYFGPLLTAEFFLNCLLFSTLYWDEPRYSFLSIYHAVIPRTSWIMCIGFEHFQTWVLPGCFSCNQVASPAPFSC